MIYKVTRTLMSAALKGFFYRIHYIGLNKLDTSVPTIFIVNHPSALMDPLVVATAMKSELHFIAAAEYFGHPLVSWVLKNELNMVPVYRPNIKGNEGTGNQDMFRACYDCLSNSGSLMIFPEGTSKTVYKLRELKTGTIRIWRGANEKLKSQGKEVNIVPVGLHYTDPHKFQSEVFVKFGLPIEFDRLSYNPEWNEGDEIRHETDWIYQNLRQQLVHIEEDQLEDDFRLLERIFGFELLSDLSVGKNEAEKKLLVLQQLAKALQYFYKEKKAEIEDLISRLKLLDLKLTKDRIFAPLLNRRNNFLWPLVFVILTFPVHLLSVIINGPPFIISKWVIAKQIKPKIKKPSEDRYGEGIQFHFSSTAFFSTGVIIFLIYYLFLAFGIGDISSYWLSLLSFFVFYFLGRLSLKWLKEFYWIKKHFHVWKLFSLSRKKYYKYKMEYLEILEELKTKKNNWLAVSQPTALVK